MIKYDLLEIDIIQHKSDYNTHRGPNGEKVGDTIICIDTSSGKFRNGNYLDMHKKYIIMNPNGGSNDVRVYTGHFADPHEDAYYDWNRFVSLEKFRQIQIDKII